MRKTLLTILLLTIVFTANAQDKPQVKATITPDSMMIGDHFTLKVEITKDVMQIVDFPIFENGEIAKAIEILSENDVDTIAKDGRNVTIGKSYTLTSFDEGNYTLGRFPALYIDKNIVDTIWSADSLKFTIHTMAVDTVNQKIYDIKQPLKAPLKFGEIGGYAAFGTLLAIIIAAIVYIIIRKLKNRPLIRTNTAPLPAHVVAIQELEKVHAQKLWQSGKQKQYYTAVTDILRTYIEQRYGIMAMEMTTAEIVGVMATAGVPDRAVNRLKETLGAADYVKFAKYQPDGETNEKAYIDAYYFVEDTKLNQQMDHVVAKGDESAAAEPQKEEGTK